MPFTLDPSAVLDFAIDWSRWLQGGEAVTAATWTLPDDNGAPVEASGHDRSTDGGVCTIWLTGGTVGCTYSLTCHVVTSMGREDDRTITIESRER